MEGMSLTELKRELMRGLLKEGGLTWSLAEMAGPVAPKGLS